MVFVVFVCKKILKNTEGEKKKGQAIEIGNKTQNEDKKKPQHKCVGHHYTQTNTNNVNKTWVLLHTTGCQDESKWILDQ